MSRAAVSKAVGRCVLPDCLLPADNALSHPDELAPYVAALACLPGFAAVTLPVGKGLHVAHRRR